MSSVLDIKIKKCRDYTLLVYLKDINNEPISIMGWSGQAQIRESTSADSDLITDLEIVIENAVDGKIGIYCDKTKTNTCHKIGYWDLVLTNAEGLSNTYITGSVAFIDVPTILN